jgi:hypothetical protein
MSKIDLKFGGSITYTYICREQLKHTQCQTLKKIS